MVEFKQLILPGDVGADVLAVKRTLRRMGVKGSGALNLTRNAGPAFVATVKIVQRNHSLTGDGKYGRDTHAIVAPHFNRADALLYGRAAIRKHTVPPPPPGGEAAAAAKQLLELQGQGKYHADNPGDLKDIEATAAGQAVRSQHGGFVHVDPRVFQVLIHLIDLGHTIGTFAICSDHHDDGPNGHAGGKAVDISTIDGHSVASPSSRAQVLIIDKALQNAGALKPRQLISGGCGNVRDTEISALCIPGADSFYGHDVMQEHCNHIHIGY
jgi:putative peptidoglycan binding protein